MNAAPQTREDCKLELIAEILREFSEVRFVAHGTSMLPAIYPGDCLTVRSFGDAPPHRGDVVLCRRGEGFRVHRIVEVMEEKPTRSYVLRGDALTHDDPPLPAADLLGRVISIVHLGESVALNSHQRAHYYFFRSLVRRSKVATVLLLRWHASQAQRFLHAESSSASSVGVRAECS